jgi:putative glutamine amidotransferase
MRRCVAIPVPHSEHDYAMQALAPYVHALERAGAEAVRIALDMPLHDVAHQASCCDAVLLPGSKADIDPQKYGAERDPRSAAADPARDNVDELLIQDAYNMRKPIFGICYGLQAINVWRTGTLRQHIESDINHQAKSAEAKAHVVEIAPGSLLASIVGKDRLWVNSSHHQAARQPGDALRISACSPDGIIEALEGTDAGQFVLAVQWHPERTYDSDEASRALFRAFIEAAASRHEHPRAAAPDFESLAK